MVNQERVLYHRLQFKPFLQRKRWKRKRRQVGRLKYTVYQKFISRGGSVGFFDCMRSAHVRNLLLHELHDLKAYACSNTNLGEVLFCNVIFWD